MNSSLPVPVSEIVRSLDDADGAMVKRLIERGIKIPPQPRVLEELRQLIRGRESDVRVLARVIGQDPGLLGMLFKVVRSSAYRQHQPFDSVEQILQMVGVGQTFNMVQALSLAATGGQSNRRAFEAFWARSQAIAQIAMLIADDRVSVCNIFPDQAYLAGIFHDCGVPVLLQRFSTYCKEMHLGEPGCWIDLGEEDRKFNADHCVVGYLVARHWGLPDFICDAIRFHHDISRLGNHTALTMVAILQLAIEIYHVDQQIENPEWHEIQATVLSELGFREDSLSEFIDDILERFHVQERNG
jgi:HD-like signal output (HDOD) protein